VLYSISGKFGTAMVCILAGCIQVKIPIGRPNKPGIAQCGNVRGLRRVSLIDEIENVNT